MKALAILKDSFREVVDRKVFIVLCVVSALFILVSASISFSPRTSTDLIRESVDNVRVLQKIYYGGVGVHSYPWKIGIEDVSDRPDGGYQFRLKLPLSEYDRIVAQCKNMKGGKYRKAKLHEERDPTDEEIAGVTDADRRDYLQERLTQIGFSEVAARNVGDSEYEVSCKAEFLRRVKGGYVITMFFGLARIPSEEISLADAVTFILTLLSETVAGWFGIIIAVIVTAGFIPNMLQKGTLDLLLAKPIERATLMTYKYLGGLTFVFLNAVVLVGGSWLALSLRSGYWNFKFLGSILVITFFFAILYAFAAFIGVLTRSAVTSILLTLFLWMFSWAVSFVRYDLPVTLQMLSSDSKISGGVRTGVNVLYYVLPKTSDMKKINTDLLSKDDRREADRSAVQRLQREAEAPEVDYRVTLATSLGWIAVLIGLSCWVFSRRDY